MAIGSPLTTILVMVELLYPWLLAIYFVGLVCTRMSSGFHLFIDRGSVVTLLYSSFKHGV